MIFKRVIILIVDGCGIGFLPDAMEFGDRGANTLVNAAKYCNGLALPNLESLGLGNITSIKGVKKTYSIGCYGKCAEKNKAKNTDAGHWEMMGYIKNPPFKKYPKGFPEELILKLEKLFGTKLIGNYQASGTEIIKKLGNEHMKTGYPIIYTSADSVLQLAAHIEVIPLKKLYAICEIARNVCVNKYEVGRIIARPFCGKNGYFFRVNDKRKDYAYRFSKETLLDSLKKKEFATIAYGEVGELFAMKGISKYYHTTNNKEGITLIKKLLKTNFAGIVFGNLTDTDMLYGHRRNPFGFKDALESLDLEIGDIITKLKSDDLLIVTADHGNDPTFKGTDHTREYIPLMIYGKNTKQAVNLGIRKSFSDIGKTIAENYSVKLKEGKSFLKEIT
ncbi:MAG: phosphopentomutase [archaeon]